MKNNVMMQIIDENLGIDEKGTWKVDNDSSADWCIDKIKEIQADYNRFSIVAKERISQLQMKLDKEKEKVDNEISFFESKLREYFETVDKKETKTQLSYKLPSGNLKMRKGKLDFDYDKDKLLTYAKENSLEELIKTSESFTWSEFKKKIEIQDNNIISKETGEVLEIEGLAVIEKPSEFKVEV